jgi:hypothetical protein
MRRVSGIKEEEKARIPGLHAMESISDTKKGS